MRALSSRPPLQLTSASATLPTCSTWPYTSPICLQPVLLPYWPACPPGLPYSGPRTFEENLDDFNQFEERFHDSALEHTLYSQSVHNSGKNMAVWEVQDQCGVQLATGKRP